MTKRHFWFVKPFLGTLGSLGHGFHVQETHLQEDYFALGIERGSFGLLFTSCLELR